MLFLKTCLLCWHSTHNSLPLCKTCLQSLKPIGPHCQQCAEPFSAIHNVNVLCGQCLSKPPSFKQVYTPYIYEAPISKFITQLKFHEELHYSHILAKLFLYAFLNSQSSETKPELIIPVPLHRKRLKKRGFNQALEIAKPISKTLNIPINYSVCERNRNTQPQSELHAKQRVRNIKGAFRCQQKLSVKHIVIFDDVITTSQTVRELALILKQQDVTQIDVWCCARAAG